MVAISLQATDSQDGVANILWFGIHGGENAPYGMLDLLNKKDVLIELNRTKPLQLVVVSDSREKFKRSIEPLPLRTLYIEWGSIAFGEHIARKRRQYHSDFDKSFYTLQNEQPPDYRVVCGRSYRRGRDPKLSRSCAILCSQRLGTRSAALSGKQTVGEKHTRSARAHILEHHTIRQIGDAWAKHLAPFVD